jgi:hypothetical protein
LRISDSREPTQQLFPALSPAAPEVAFCRRKSPSRDFPSLFRHLGRHKNLPGTGDKNAFRGSRIAQYCRRFRGLLSPQFTGLPQDLVFDSDLMTIYC